MKKETDISRQLFFLLLLEEPNKYIFLLDLDRVKKNYEPRKGRMHTVL